MLSLVVHEVGWRAADTGAPPTAADIRCGWHETTNLLRALDLLSTGADWQDHSYGLTSAGRAVALECLHHRATGPRSSPGGEATRLRRAQTGLTVGGATREAYFALVQFETPRQLFSRLKLGREEYCQRLLTSLILDGPYPPWNTRRRPGPAGLAFLRGLYERAFRDSWPGDRAVFVDEFELPPRHDRENGDAPDYAVLWADRLWMIELKTERSSHRVAQIPAYFQLARHHHPGQPVDLLYVTPPMAAPYYPEESDSRYAPPEPGRTGAADPLDVAFTVGSRAAGGGGRPIGCHRTTRRRPYDLARPVVRRLGGAARGSRWWRATAPGRADDAGWSGSGFRGRRQTASDGKQRGVDVRPVDLEERLDLRLHREAVPVIGFTPTGPGIWLGGFVNWPSYSWRRGRRR